MLSSLGVFKRPLSLSVLKRYVLLLGMIKDGSRREIAFDDLERLGMGRLRSRNKNADSGVPPESRLIKYRNGFSKLTLIKI